MSQQNRSSTSHQLCQLRRQFAQAPGLPFSELLSAERVLRVVQEFGVTFRKRLYTPEVTLWLFLSQVLAEDPGCKAAVARLLAYRSAHGMTPCSANTGGYSTARQRLSEPVLAALARRTGQELDEQVPAEWLWKGRRVKVVDGSTVTLADTEENQRAYPQPASQRPGLGFPLARLAALFSLSCGAVLDLALGPYKGKQTGENALFRTFWACLAPGEVVLADRYYGNYFNVALLHQRGVIPVMRVHQARAVDFRRGKRLDKGDHVVQWSKPPRPEWLDAATYHSLPDRLTVREVRVHVRRNGFRTKRLVVVTTLLDPDQASVEELGELYRLRWQAELDLRSLKQTMQMELLRSQSPSMVRKEIWAHLLAYNLIRTVMAQAAHQQGLLPWTVSFKGALQTLNAFATYLLLAAPRQLPHLYRDLLNAIATHRVGNRPNRCEPRAKKRRPKPYPLLTKPRQQARAELLGGARAAT